MIDSNQNEIAVKDPELEPGVTQPPFLNQIVGLFQTIGAVPIKPPRYIQDQIQIYSHAGTFILYIWDNTNQVWRTCNLT